MSVNSVADQAEFKKNHSLNFELLTDQEGKVTELYGAKMMVVTMAKRWTFILDPQLKIKSPDYHSLVQLFFHHDLIRCPPVKDFHGSIINLKWHFTLQYILFYSKYFWWVEEFHE